MILFTRRLMPAELRLQSDRETQKSEIYFTNYTLTGQPEAFRSGSQTRQAIRRPTVSTYGRSRGACQLYFTDHTLAGNRRLIRSGVRRWQAIRRPAVSKLVREALAIFISPITL